MNLTTKQKLMQELAISKIKTANHLLNEAEELLIKVRNEVKEKK